MKNSMKIICLLFLSLLVSCSSDDEDTAPPQYTLDNIQGDWYRVGGNNPEYNGMLVNVVDNTGTVVNPASSTFNTGDIKWKTIVAKQNNTYDHKELGSDNDYYDATMKLGVDDTLRISVGNSGSGNVQKWVRQLAELNDCSPYQVGDYTAIKNGTWLEVNDEHNYPGLLSAVSDAGGGYYTVSLTNDSGIVPWMTIRSSDDPYGSISSGSAIGSQTPTERKTSFLVHPGVSYDVDAIYSSYINVNHAVNYTIEYTFTGRMDCWEPNDFIEDAKAIPKNESIEAYAITGYKFNYNDSGSPQTHDYYKVQVFEPAKLQMELLQVPTSIKLRVNMLKSDGVVLGVQYDVISGDVNGDGGKFYTTTNQVLQPGIYILKVEIAGSRKTVINQWNNETIPDHWDTPYKFKVTTVQ
ncbi:hypothetical protein [Aequorivita sp. KMM 9714]|uniref:hypothetical protein n=1 Tax=Aequorivita sp. KMM 9714 TaxID=2707173 RepID=UPI0013EA36C8|nr:hypothetical protein [Aequorivita sp. KMM 9714]NGX84788.1 hypothetical protein [Aequorivita sp. KMM 9714]